MTEAQPRGLPHGLALAWGLVPEPTRGPRRGLTLAQIVAAAIEIADAEGLAAVSMARVAATFGFSTMSLYRYVESKDDLLLLMQDAASPAAVPAQRPGHEWREALRDWTRILHERLLAHPWLLDIPVSGPPITPSGLRMADAAAGALREAPSSHDEKLAVLVLLSGYARSSAQLRRDLGAVGYFDGERQVEAGRALADLVTAERFAHLHPIFASGAYLDTAGTADDGDDLAFGFGLERILDGLEAFLAGRASTPGPATGPHG